MKANKNIIIKTSFRFLFFLMVTGSLVVGWQVWQNNRSVAPVTNTVINNHFIRSVDWLDSNYSTLENNKNPILWWMVKQAASTSNNKTLTNIFAKYKKNHLDTHPANLSTPMFNEFYRPRVPDISALSHLYDYQIFFFYGLSCDNDLGSEPIIQKQLNANYCSSYYFNSTCITHQLMGLRFMQRYQCGDEETVNYTIAELQNKVISELTWDFRVGDAYIQRVLMLVDTGAYNEIKPLWIKNILNAQNDDGGWDDLDPIIYLGNDYVFAYTSRLPTTIKKSKANFHTTAQAIWLLSLLLKETEINP